MRGSSGIALYDWDKGWIANNSWIRGTCQYGIMPANGFLYAPPNSCACYAAVKVSGFFAAAPRRGKEYGMPLPEKAVPVKGSAYGKTGAATVGEDDWPLYRRDNERNGVTSMKLGKAVKRLWREKVADTKLTQPVVVGSHLLVAGVDTHTVYAFDAESGRKSWEFVAGGRIDSAPTLYKG